jgi:hypothetical protein
MMGGQTTARPTAKPTTMSQQDTTTDKVQPSDDCKKCKRLVFIQQAIIVYKTVIILKNKYLEKKRSIGSI